MPIVGTPGHGQGQSGVGKTPIGTVNLPGGTVSAPNVTLTAAQQAWLAGHSGAQVGPGGTLHGPGRQLGQPGGSGLPGAGGGGGLGGGGGGGGGGGSDGGTSSGPVFTISPFPTFKAPSWWTGPPKNLSDVAGMIRNAFFAGLGSLDGYPYSTQQIYQAYLFPMIVSQNQTEPDVLPATLTITIYDSAGNQISQDVVTMTTFSSVVAVPGTYSLADSYTIEVIASVVGASSLTSHYGPFQASAFASVGSPVPLTVPYNPAGTAAGSFTFVNADGSPAVGVPVAIGIYSPASDTQEVTSVGAPSNAATNAKGQITWAAQLQFLSPDGVYTIGALVYSGSLNADGTISGSLLGTWTSPNLTYDQIQTYTPPTIFLDALSPPPNPSGTATGPGGVKKGGPGPGHHGRT